MMSSLCVLPCAAPVALAAATAVAAPLAARSVQHIRKQQEEQEDAVRLTTSLEE
jgi:hypothetical protein